MRIVALLYIVFSVAANFWIGSLSTFVLAALSFPLLVWLVVTRKRKKPTQPEVGNNELNNPDVF